MNQIESELYYKITQASNIIHQTSLKGSGNFIIVSPKIAEKIKRIEIKEQRRKKLEILFKKI